MLLCCVADVFDTPRWKEMASGLKPETLLLRLLACIDGIPAFTCNGITLMPFEFMLLSLPPWLRYKVDNMFISMLIPSSLSPEAQRKYFQKVIDCDLNPMMREGLDVPGLEYPVKVQIFAQVSRVDCCSCIHNMYAVICSIIILICFCFVQSLDLKGKEKFHDQVSVQSFVGCSHCCVTFPKGCQGPVFGVARRYLPDGHPLRRQVSAPYEYPGEETRGKITTHTHINSHSYTHSHTHAGPDPPKTTAIVCHAAVKAKDEFYTHYLGQKGLPMFASLDNFDYQSFNLPEWMHNLSR